MSNLPPGVTETMIPGNRPGDAALEELTEKFMAWLTEHNVGPYEDDDQETYERFYSDAWSSLIDLVNRWERDPIEEAVRKSNCEDCGEKLGKGYVTLKRRSPDGDGTDYEYEVSVHTVCPRDLGKFAVGQRVRVVQDVERYPFFVVKPGAIGTVTRLSGDEMDVKMDDEIPGCEDWDNHVMYTADDEGLQYRELAIHEQCQWFHMCTNVADGIVPHPILGDVPTCQSCASKLDLDIKRYDRKES